MSSFFKHFKNFKAKLSGKTIVGSDKFGNTYFTKYHGGVERRFCERKENDEDEDREIPPEWNSWLLKVRSDPPSEELSFALDRERQSRYIKAVKYDKELEEKMVKYRRQVIEGEVDEHETSDFQSNIKSTMYSKTRKD